jgi:hypothetical protein
LTLDSFEHGEVRFAGDDGWRPADSVFERKPAPDLIRVDYWIRVKRQNENLALRF